MDVFFTAPLDNGSNIGAIYQFFNAGSYVDYSFVFFVPTAGQTELDLEAAAVASQVAYATAHSYTVTNTQKWYVVPTIPTPAFKSYQALVSQTGTSAPTQTALENDFGSTTFTWARTSAGVYTLTANTSVFTSAKTAILLSPTTTPLNNASAVRTSGTVLTFTSSSLNILALGVANADAVLSNTLVEVRVFN